VIVDVTAGVTVGGKVAFAIANGGGNGVHFWSKEGSRPPTLQVATMDVPSGDDSAAVEDDSTFLEEDSVAGDDPAKEGMLPGEPDSLGGCGCSHAGSFSTVFLFAGLLRRRRSGSQPDASTG
jgi:hypothetical protein